MITRQYIYNKVRGKVAATLLLPLSSLLFAGCSDFLDVLPLDQVVLEKFWTEKADVTSVVNSCYAGLEDGDVMTRMMVWGELRSSRKICCRPILCVTGRNSMRSLTAATL